MLKVDAGEGRRTCFNVDTGEGRRICFGENTLM